MVSRQQATGNGHLTRSRLMAQALAKHQVSVDYLVSGRTPDKLFNMDSFGAYRCVSGLSFATRNGRIQLASTLAQAKLTRCWRDYRSLSLDDYDLVISDFEPITAWAARRQQRPCLGVSHQAALVQAVPFRQQRWLAKAILKGFAPCQQRVGLHWHHFGLPLLPPIIDTGLRAESTCLGSMVVYLPFEEPAAIQATLDSLPHHYQFHCFHPALKAPMHRDNIHFYPPDQQHFHRRLLRCEGVIANGGFELPSEALYLGKKLLVKPLHGQFEQYTNVKTLAALGLASVMDELHPLYIRDWLQSSRAEPMAVPNVAAALAQWIADGAQQSLAELAAILWQQVQYPRYAQLPAAVLAGHYPSTSLQPRSLSS